MCTGKNSASTMNAVAYHVAEFTRWASCGWATGPNTAIRNRLNAGDWRRPISIDQAHAAPPIATGSSQPRSASKNSTRHSTHTAFATWNTLRT